MVRARNKRKVEKYFFILFFVLLVLILVEVNKLLFFKKKKNTTHAPWARRIFLSLLEPHSNHIFVKTRN